MKIKEEKLKEFSKVMAIVESLTEEVTMKAQKDELVFRFVYQTVSMAVFTFNKEYFEDGTINPFECNLKTSYLKAAMSNLSKKEINIEATENKVIFAGGGSMFEFDMLEVSEKKTPPTFENTCVWKIKTAILSDFVKDYSTLGNSCRFKTGENLTVTFDTRLISGDMRIDAEKIGEGIGEASYGIEFFKIITKIKPLFKEITLAYIPEQMCDIYAKTDNSFNMRWVLASRVAIEDD